MNKLWFASKSMYEKYETILNIHWRYMNFLVRLTFNVNKQNKHSKQKFFFAFFHSDYAPFFCCTPCLFCCWWCICDSNIVIATLVLVIWVFYNRPILSNAVCPQMLHFCILAKKNRLPLLLFAFISIFFSFEIHSAANTFFWRGDSFVDKDRHQSILTDVYCS